MGVGAGGGSRGLGWLVQAVVGWVSPMGNGGMGGGLVNRAAHGRHPITCLTGCLQE